MSASVPIRPHDRGRLADSPRLVERWRLWQDAEETAQVLAGLHGELADDRSLILKKGLESFESETYSISVEGLVDGQQTLA